MFENIKKGFAFTMGAFLAGALVHAVGEMTRDKPKENNENPEEKEES